MVKSFKTLEEVEKALNEFGKKGTVFDRVEKDGKGWMVVAKVWN